MSSTDFLQSVLETYNKNKESASGNSKLSRDERMKKFFTTLLPDGKTSGEKRIRIIPDKDGKMTQVRFHEIQVDGKWVKLYDPAQDGLRSPLNEVREKLLATGREDDKELARNYLARPFYIFKVIDRDNEEDGPKFWRFKHSFKNEGVMDKLYPIFQKIKEPVDPVKGRDLTLFLTLTSANNGKTYTKISTIMAEDPSPLHEDPAKMKEWLEDELEWDDAYAKKPIEYLDIVARGETPKWDKDKKQWVSDQETTSSSDDVVEGGVEIQGGVTVETEADYEDPQMDDEESDDLPF